MREPVAIPGGQDERAAELKRILADPMLTVALAARPGARREVEGPEELEDPAAPEPRRVVGDAPLVDQQREVDPGLLAERRGVRPPAEADRGDAGAAPFDLLFPVAQPGDVLAAEDSAVVAEEREGDGPRRPKGAETNVAPLRIGEDQGSEGFRDGARHAGSVPFARSPGPRFRVS